MRLILQTIGKEKKAKIYWNGEYAEYVVKFYSLAGVYLGEDCDYFTSDKTDAVMTANTEIDKASAFN